MPTPISDFLFKSLLPPYTPLHSPGLTEDHLQSQTLRQIPELSLPSRALTSAFWVDPAANRDRGAYKEALPFLFFPTEVNLVSQHLAGGALVLLGSQDIAFLFCVPGLVQKALPSCNVLFTLLLG